jgi:hypothetical protein
MKIHYFYFPSISFLALAVIMLGTDISHAQYSRNNQGYGGYNQSYGNSYGNSYGGGGGYANYGGSSMGRAGGMMGMSGGMSGSSRMGSTRGSSRGSSRMGGNYNASAGYGNMQSGYNTQGRSSRSSRSSRYGTTNTQQGNSYIPQSAQRNTGTGQTTSSGVNTTRNQALQGKVNLGQTSSRGDTKSPGSIQMMGSGKQAASGAKKPAKGVGTKAASAKPRKIATLYASGKSTIAVVGKPMTVDILLANPNGVGFNQMAFTLKFNPAVLSPISSFDETTNEPVIATSVITSVSQDDARIKDLASIFGQIELSPKEFMYEKNPDRYIITKNEVDAGKGIVRFALDVPNESSTDNGIVARVHFMPREESKSTSVSFSFVDPDYPDADMPATYLAYNGSDQLSSAYDPNDGVINFDLEVVSSLDKKGLGPVVRDQSDLQGDEDLLDDYNTRLTLLTDTRDIDVGDYIDVDVYLSNPSQQSFDSVNLLIAYNTRIFEAVDLDDFSPGINLSDKEYSEQFPFDFPLVNLIDQEKGLIDYRKRVNRAPVRGEGVMATIRLKAIRPTKKTTLRIFMNENGEEPTTGIFYRTMDRLGDPANPYDGVKTTSISVRPTTAYLQKIRSSIEKG